jgi:hypothetical protein
VYVEIREPFTGKMLFLYDPDAQRIQIQRHGVRTSIDLTVYRSKRAPEQAARTDQEHDVGGDE